MKLKCLFGKHTPVLAGVFKKDGKVNGVYTCADCSKPIVKMDILDMKVEEDTMTDWICKNNNDEHIERRSITISKISEPRTYISLHEVGLFDKREENDPDQAVIKSMETLGEIYPVERNTKALIYKFVSKLANEGMCIVQVPENIRCTHDLIEAYLNRR